MNAYLRVLGGILGLELLVFPSVAFAYIDPATGSYIFQLLVGSMMAAGVLVRLYWQSVKSFIGRFRSGPSDDQ